MIGMPSGLIDCAPQIASDRPSESDRSRCTAVDLYSDPFFRVEDTDADEARRYSGECRPPSSRLGVKNARFHRVSQ